MRLRSLLIAALVLICFWVGPLPLPLASARIYIDINSPFAQQFPLAVPEMKPLAGPTGAEAAAGLVATLRSDMDLSGLFQLLDPKGFLEDPTTMGLTADQTNFQAWSMVGADFLVKGGFQSDGQRFQCELRLFDVKRAQLLVGKRYSGTVNDFRLMAHRFADEIMKQITGQEGPFSTRLAFVSTVSANKEIFVADFDGGEPKQLTRYKSITLAPVWAPGGQGLVFTSYKDGQPFLYQADLASGKVRRLSGYKGLNIGGAFSPDGQNLVVTLTKDGDPELYLLTAQGQVVRRLTNSPGIDVSASFSPNGRQIVFVSDRHGGPQLFIMNLADGATRRLTFEGNYNTSPAWSPRGDRIAYEGMRDGQFNICTIAPDGRDFQQLTRNQGNNEEPSWSADGRMIVFSSTREGGSAIYSMTANGGNVRRIIKLQGKQTSPTWSGRLWR